MVVRMNPALSSITFGNQTKSPTTSPKAIFVAKEGAHEVKTASTVGRYLRNFLLGAVSLTTVATTSCGKKDDPQPMKQDTTEIKAKPLPTIEVTPTPTITVDPTPTVVVTPPVDPPTPPLSTLKNEFVKVAPDIFAVDSASATKLIADGSKDSVLINIDGAPTSLRFLKEEGDTLYFNQLGYNAAMVPNGNSTYKFTKDKTTSQLVETIRPNIDGAPTVKSVLSKGTDGTTQIVKDVKRNLFSAVDQLSSKVLNLRQNTYSYIKCIK